MSRPRPPRPTGRRPHPAVSAVLASLAGIALAAMSVLLVMHGSSTGDYIVSGAPGGDNPGPAIAALAHLSLHGLVASQPFMGLTSLLLRAPAAGLAAFAGGGNRLIYGAGAVACLAPVGALAVWLPWRARHAGAWLAGALLLAGPATTAALSSGHPEELLAAALATVAVLVAVGGRWALAGVLLGAAVGTKQWAAIALLPVLAALPGRRAATAALAGGLGLLLAGALALLDPHAFAQAGGLVGSGHTANVASAWWPFSTPIPATSARRLPWGLDRSHALIAGMVLSGGLSALATGHALARGRRVAPLALLALLGVARCLADPGDLEYYWVAALVPLAVHESLCLRRVPVVAGLASVTLSLTLSLHLGPVVVSSVLLALGVAVAALVAREAFAHPAASPARPAARLKVVLAPSDH